MAAGIRTGVRLKFIVNAAKLYDLPACHHVVSFKSQLLQTKCILTRSKGTG
jgi:hypothetical protein